MRNGSDRDEEHIFIEADFGQADHKSLQIGKFYQRGGYNLSFWPRKEAAEKIEYVLRDYNLIGLCPSFDEERLRLLVQENNRCPSWHYRPHDIEDICLGYLRGLGQPAPDLPIDSDAISRLIDVEPPNEFERHTAMGDARWCEQMWEKVVGF
jgi:hypothetical protein